MGREPRERVARRIEERGAFGQHGLEVTVHAVQVGLFRHLTQQVCALEPVPDAEQRRAVGPLVREQPIGEPVADIGERVRHHACGGDPERWLADELLEPRLAAIRMQREREHRIRRRTGALSSRLAPRVDPATALGLHQLAPELVIQRFERVSFV